MSTLEYKERPPDPAQIALSKGDLSVYFACSVLGGEMTAADVRLSYITCSNFLPGSCTANVGANLATAVKSCQSGQASLFKICSAEHY